MHHEDDSIDAWAHPTTVYGGVTVCIGPAECSDCCPAAAMRHPPVAESAAAPSDGCSTDDAAADGTPTGVAVASPLADDVASGVAAAKAPQTAVEVVLGVTATGWLTGVRRKLAGSWSGARRKLSGSATGAAAGWCGTGVSTGKLKPALGSETARASRALLFALQASPCGSSTQSLLSCLLFTSTLTFVQQSSSRRWSSHEFGSYHSKTKFTASLIADEEERSGRHSDAK